MPGIKFYDTDPGQPLIFAVIMAKSGGKWVFCRHRERYTYEFPGGHREPGEHIDEAASRELQEETGALDFDIRPVCFYSVTDGAGTSFGKLYAAEIRSFGPLHSEIEEILITGELVDNWTYPRIQPKLLEEAKRRGSL